MLLRSLVSQQLFQNLIPRLRIRNDAGNKLISWDGLCPGRGFLELSSFFLSSVSFPGASAIAISFVGMDMPHFVSVHSTAGNIFYLQSISSDCVFSLYSPHPSAFCFAGSCFCRTQQNISCSSSEEWMTCGHPCYRPPFNTKSPALLLVSLCCQHPWTLVPPFQLIFAGSSLPSFLLVSQRKYCIITFPFPLFKTPPFCSAYRKSDEQLGSVCPETMACLQ